MKGKKRKEEIEKGVSKFIDRDGDWEKEKRRNCRCPCEVALSLSLTLSNTFASSLLPWLPLDNLDYERVRVWVIFLFFLPSYVFLAFFAAAQPEYTIDPKR